MCYIPSTTKGKNVLKALDKMNIPYSNVNFTDSETEFLFNVKYIHDVANLVKAKTKGVGISALSSDNLEWHKYKIPREELQQYRSLEVPFNKSSQLMNQFAKYKKIDTTKDYRLARLKGKEYFHSVGLWKEFVLFAKKYMKSINDSK